jgi:hypothetical protein
VFYLSIGSYFYSYLLVAQHQSITAAGHINQTFSFTSTVASVAISFVIKYTKHYKPYIILGSFIYLAGIGLMIRYRSNGSTVGQIVGAQIAVGIGGGMINVPAQLGVQASASHQQVAAATAVFLTIVEVGGAVGSAIAGAVWSSTIPSKLVEYGISQSDAMAIYNSVDVATSYAVGTSERIAIDRAYQDAMRVLLIVAICVAAPIVPLALIMRNYRLDDMGGEQVKGRVIGGNVGDNRVGDEKVERKWAWWMRRKQEKGNAVDEQGR